MSMKLYYWPRSSATRVQWALEELGVPCERVRLNREKGENRAPEFLALSPQGNIPALVDGDARLFESVAILVHLGQKYGAERGLWPKDPADAAEALSWCVWSTAELGVQRSMYSLQTLDAPYALPKEDRNPRVAERAKKGYYDRVAVLEKRMASRDWLVGRTFTLADVAVAQFVAGAQARLGLSLADYPNVASWVSRCTARPAFQRVTSET